MLDSATQQAFLRALEGQPEFRAAVRRQLLTQDLLELPERFAEYAAATDRRLTNLETTLANFMEATDRRLQALEQGQDELKSEMAEVKSEMAEVKSEMAEVKSEMAGVHTRLDSMDRRMDRMDGRMDNGFGTNYEIKVGNNFGSLSGRYLRLRRTRVLKAAIAPAHGNLSDMIADAEDRGVITEEEANDLLAVDLIASGRSRDNGHDVYVAAEVSITIADQDIARAAERAGYLAKATGQAAVPAVIGENIAPEQEELARQRDVTIMLLPAG